jgi:phosphatidylglycerophosphate synthase
MGLKNLKFALKAQDLLGKVFSIFPFSPNQLSFLSIFLGLFGFLASVFKQPISIIFFGFAALLDVVDGALARKKNLSSPKGAFIDGICDRIVEFFLILSFLFYDFEDFLIPKIYYLLTILFFGSTMSSFVIAYADHRGLKKQNPEKVGIFQRPERIAVLLFALLSVFFFSSFTSFILFFASILSLLTFLQRFFFFLEK